MALPGLFAWGAPLSSRSVVRCLPAYGIVQPGGRILAMGGAEYRTTQNLITGVWYYGFCRYSCRAGATVGVPYPAGAGMVALTRWRGCFCDLTLPDHPRIAAAGGRLLASMPSRWAIRCCWLPSADAWFWVKRLRPAGFNARDYFVVGLRPFRNRRDEPAGRRVRGDPVFAQYTGQRFYRRHAAVHVPRTHPSNVPRDGSLDTLTRSCQGDGSPGTVRRKN